MNHLRLLAILVLSTSHGIFSQCPTNPFSLPDSVCPGLPFTIDNNNSSASNWSWDFSLGDLNNTPTISTISGGGSLNYPAQMKVIQDGGEYFGFVPNSGTNYITRYDFGNSPSNIPAIVNLATDPIYSGFGYCIEMVKENNKWIGFLTLFTGGKILRLEFDSIKQTNPILTDLGNTNLFGPFSIKIVDDYLFVTNQLTEISRFTFNGSYLNTPTPLLPNIQSGNFNNAGIDIVYDCQTGNYTGFVSSLAADQIDRLDFGNSLGNQPSVTPILSITDPNGISVIKEGKDWHLFTVTENNRLFHYNFTSGPESSVLYDYDSDFGGAFSGPKNLQFVKLNSEWFGLIPNTLLFAIRRLSFPAGITSVTPTSSVDQSPANILYNSGTTGIQFMELTETFADGSSLVFTDSTVVAILPPKAAFVNSSGCEGRAVNFTDQSISCTGAITQWFWSFGDGATSTVQHPSHSYSNTGTFQVTLKIYNSIGDSSTITVPILIEANPIADFSAADSVCQGAILVLDNLSTAPGSGAINTHWDFGDGNQSTTYNTNHIYIQTGIFLITQVVSTDNGCSDTTGKFIRILEKPSANFNVQNTCIGESSIFQNLSQSTTSQFISYSWDFGDGNSTNQNNPTYNYPANPASYLAELIVETANGCSDTISRNVKIADKPRPWFIIPDDTICEGFPFQIIDSSFSASGGQPDGRIWDFGDGSSDSLSVNPIHIFQSAGNYNITLKAISLTDCDSAISRSIVVIEKPNAAFTATDVCFGDTIGFTDASTTSPGTFLVAWEWTFDDSSSSFSTNPVHTYTAPGEFQVRLQVTNSKGCNDEAIDTVRVYPIPEPYFINSKPCTGNPVLFTDSSYVSSGSISSWNWTFGINGPTSTVQNPDFTFSTAGAVSISLEVISNEGCRDSVARLIGIDQSPLISLSTDGNCLGTPTLFQLQSNGPTLFYLAEWDFGDSTSSNLFNPTHHYNYPGLFPVSVQVVDTTNNCVRSLSDTTVIWKNPDAKFESDSGCVNDTIQFIDISQAGDGYLVRHEWTFGNISQSQLPDPILVISNPDSVLVRLIVENSFGCIDSSFGSLQIYPLPFAGFQPNLNYGSIPLEVDFSNQSDFPGNYEWNFGDGSPTSILQNPTHVFLDTGTFNVLLTVTSPRGCQATFGRNIAAVSPYLDLGIIGLSFNLIENEWKIKANLRNTGNVEINDFIIIANLDGKSQISENFNLKIMPSTNVQTTFKSGFTAYEYDSPRYLCLEIIEVNGVKDESAENDKNCTTTSTGFEVISINPNPADDYFNLSINTLQRGRLEIIIIDGSGRMVLEPITHDLNKGFNSILIDQLPESSGVYSLQIRFRENLVTKKIIVR